MNIRSISRTEMAARFAKHRRRIVEGDTLANAVRSCECFAIGDDAALAIDFDAPGSAFVSLAVSASQRGVIDDLEQAIGQLCTGRLTRFHTKRRALVGQAHLRGWRCVSKTQTTFEMAKAY